MTDHPPTARRPVESRDTPTGHTDPVDLDGDPGDRATSLDVDADRDDHAAETDGEATGGREKTEAREKTDAASPRARVLARWRAFVDWRRTRPLLAGVLLLVSGAAIGWLPVAFVGDVLFVASGLPVLVGLVNALLVAYLGVLVLVRPAYARPIGAAGLVLSTLSVFTTLGGLGVGLVTGGAGGILCFAWDGPERDGEDPVAGSDDYEEKSGTQ